ncbi:MAG: zf-HC2 domain-containing protein [Chitinispirillales bacterium]|jgi:hypothetical protein|nr:zf-HC2 domain-containing protein [Chitinispirillales bacterium]
MECSKFEVSGLLYVSGELSDSEAREYESHLGSCEECRAETEAYRRERAAYYTPEILGERPRPEVDSEILRVCSNPKKAAAATFMPMLFLKKYAPIGVFLMLVMVAIGGYIRYHSMAADDLRAKYDAGKSTDAVAIERPKTAAIGDSAQAAAGGDEKLALSDSAASAGDSNAAFSKTRGNLDVEGVVPVKGEGK